MRIEAGENSLGKLVREITERDVRPHSKYLLINKHGKRMTKGMLRLRWDTFRNAVMTVLHPPSGTAGSDHQAGIHTGHTLHQAGLPKYSGTFRLRFRPGLHARPVVRGIRGCAAEPAGPG